MFPHGLLQAMLSNYGQEYRVERVSPFQSTIEEPRSSISGYSMHETLRQDWSN